jgi:IS5 family transposase
VGRDYAVLNAQSRFLTDDYLKGRHGDQINAVMSPVGYNFRLILKWFRALLCEIIATIWAAMMPFSALGAAS